MRRRRAGTRSNEAWRFGPPSLATTSHNSISAGSHRRRPSQWEGFKEHGRLHGQAMKEIYRGIRCALNQPRLRDREVLTMLCCDARRKSLKRPQAVPISLDLPRLISHPKNVAHYSDRWLGCACFHARALLPYRYHTGPHEILKLFLFPRRPAGPDTGSSPSPSALRRSLSK